MSKYWLVKLRGSGGVGMILILLSLSSTNTALALNLNSAQDDLSNVSQVVNETVGGIIKDLIPAGSVNINTGNLDLKKFFSLTGISTNDLTGVLKGVAVLSIQILITVVSVVSQIVKGILQALNIDIGIGGF